MMQATVPSQQQYSSKITFKIKINNKKIKKIDIHVSFAQSMEYKT